MDLLKLTSFIISDYLNESNDNIPKILYHGTDIKFNSIDYSKPIFFVNSIDIARTYGKHIIEAQIQMDNPIELDFEGMSTYYFQDKWYVPSELALKIKEIAEDIENGYTIEDDLTDYMETLGYNGMYGDLDGIVMKNIRDASDGIFSNNEPANNYVVFKREQVKILR